MYQTKTTLGIMLKGTLLETILLERTDLKREHFKKKKPIPRGYNNIFIIVHPLPAQLLVGVADYGHWSKRRHILSRLLKRKMSAKFAGTVPYLFLSFQMNSWLHLILERLRLMEWSSWVQFPRVRFVHHAQLLTFSRCNLSMI